MSEAPLVVSTVAPHFTRAPSADGRRRLMSVPGEPLFLAAWDRVLMTHFEVDADELQHDVPFMLDLWEGRAFVTLVTFKLRGMRPRIGGKWSEWLFRPIATHEFLNVRTYVCQDGEPGIHFLAEWLSSRFAVKLGPSTFSLPYRHGAFSFEPAVRGPGFLERITDTAGGDALSIRMEIPGNNSFVPCTAGSLDEWLMERYSSFNSVGGRPKLFRVLHPPWQERGVAAVVEENSLLTRNWSWFADASVIGANFSPGIDEVWMGRPHGLSR